jgi:hypothetical protein
VNLTRTAEGRLRVEALVETAARKQEVLRALARFNNHPAIKIEVETVAEALKRQKSSPGATILREVEVMKGMIPADPDLRRYFTQQPAHGQPIDEQINQFANRMINRSRQALLHASALTRLVKRFSPETVQGLKPEAQVQYRAMINGHAEECRREIMRLYHELQPIFFPAETLEGRAGEKERTGDADPARIAEQLLQLSYTHDEMMRSAFTLSTVVRSGPPIKSLQVRRSLKAAESLVMEIQSLYQ